MGPGRAMSGIGRRGGGLALLAALWLAGCAQAPKDLYSWETFARQQHEVLRADGVQSAQQIQDMEAHAQKVRGEGAALPPGFRAHLGMLYLNTGNAGNYGLNTSDVELINFRTMAPKFLRVPDGLVTTKSMCLFDSRYALRRVISTNAAYSAIQEMVMQRTTAMRFDGASFVNRLREEAFMLLDYTNDAACS